mmetsp:Transcript_148162/g.369395  ORF Transcript_148162/g.369395 Transcript_148162/m.369395 type:complete len:369 (+) Transcript_148162:59-1165(+)|eukprot:CAMPEP_0115522934 /NCGR_PEP_ID=MMETSP0271-20121206/80359_1 /TAXON_ID=71861 /ORGANISM="Scrippsiella trochoidea, Strain CCMP3099" /LENGTH=368 /DNA_ID=CAMNT_0002954295 /DNA_START=41 /DNA_END=1147 /DNA_ORIENTATION=-
MPEPQVVARNASDLELKRRKLGEPQLASSKSGSNAHSPLLLDGGCGLELKRRKTRGENVAYDLQLFSTAALRETPEAIRQLHRDYVRAGCDVITTSSYAVTRFYLDRCGDGDRVEELARLSVELAQQAVADEGATGRVAIAASVPPLGESYHVASEVLEPAAMRAQYTELLRGLKGADIFLCETMASKKDANMACECVRAVHGTSARLWVSYNPQRKGPHAVGLRDCSIKEAVQAASAAGAEAVLFNCVTPELIKLAIDEALQHAGSLRVGGYGNFWEEQDLSGWTMALNESCSGCGDQKSGGMVVRQDLSAEQYAALAQSWLQAGASIAGGCCGIGPPEIATLGQIASIGTGAHNHADREASQQQSD